MTLWKLSAGTACVVGKQAALSPIPPTTAYIMLGGKCRNNCRFCSQARDSAAGENKLSRIVWPSYDAAEAADDIKDACAAGAFRRVCLQATNNENSPRAMAGALERLKGNGSAPISVSGYIESVDEAGALLAAGAERLCIALDAAAPRVFAAAKEGSWEKRWRLLTDCAAAFPGRISTHFIVGLGETEEEIIDCLDRCIGLNITTGLFAFTPVRGTGWAGRSAPDIGCYRRVQIGHYLLRRGYSRSVVRCRDGRIVGCAAPRLHEVLADGKAFETSGCPDCNRPFYNERPGGVLYNYPRPLTPEEIDMAIRESGLPEGGNDVLAGC